MSAKYVCATCRVQGALRKAFHLSYQRRQWLSQSTRTRQRPAESAQIHDSSGGYHDSVINEHSSSQMQDGRTRGRYSGRPLAPRELLDQLDSTGKLATSQQGSAERSHTHRTQRREPTDRLSNGQMKPIRTVRTETRPNRAGSEASELYDRLTSVTTVFDGQQPDDEEALNILRTLARTPSNETVTQTQKFGKRCFFVMRSTCDQWTTSLLTDGASTKSGPKPTEMLAAILACTRHNHSIYASTLWQLATAAVRLQPTLTTDSHKAFTSCMAELMTAWNLIMRAKLSPGSGIDLQADTTLDWSYLPSHLDLAEVLQQRRRVVGAQQASFSRTLDMFVPEVENYVGSSSILESKRSDIFDYPSAALVTLDLLQWMQAKPELALEAKAFEPWMNLMDRIVRSLGDTHVPLAVAQTLENSDHADYYRGVVARLITPKNTRKSDDASGKDPLPAPAPAPAPAPRTEQEDDEIARADWSTEHVLPKRHDAPRLSIDGSTPASRFADICSKRLGRALEQDDRRSTQRIYDDVKQFLTNNPNVLLPIDLYHELLYTFLRLRISQTAVLVWNDMVKAGHQPTLKTYTVMMRGSQAIRDRAVTMEAFWAKMRKAGLQPDHYAWSTRITGMLRSRMPVDAPMRALDEMGLEWIAAARAATAEETLSKRKKREKEVAGFNTQDLVARFAGDVSGVPRPNIAIMNSAISGLSAKAEAVHLIPKVLSWGRLFGIEPDLTTYNTLINMSMRQGLPAEALNLLRRMGEKEIEPDSETWTVLLSAMFEGGSLANLTTSEVDERVMNFLRSIDDMPGIGLDEKGYNTIVDRLLKTYDNAPGAQKILEHMVSKGIKPNAHTYTVLMTSYFQQTPPNFAAVEALWSQIHSENVGYGAVLDTLFYDRMIESYAQHHNTVGTKPMLYYLDRMEAQGKTPSWKALDFVARALAETGNWSRLSQIVERASKTKRSARLSQEPGFGEREFWRFCKSVGMTGNAYTQP